MNAVFHIAVNTFKETVRNKALYSILFFAALLIVLSISFGDWSVLARIQVMQDFGLGTMSLAGLMMSVFIGVGLLGREISGKTCYNVLTKPVSRERFIWGKFSGLMAVLTMTHVCMSGLLLFVLVFLGGAPQVTVVSALLLIWAEMAVMVAVSIFFSSITTPMLAAMLTLGFYIAGHFNDLLEIEMMKQENPVLSVLLQILYFLVPNLEHFNIRTQVVYKLFVAPEYIAWSFLYGCLYTALFTLFGGMIFSRKDL
jgi:Cu-processing system permease protein